MYNNKYDITKIRLLPMSNTRFEEDFKDEKDVRRFLAHRLPKEENGECWYLEKGINFPNDTEALVLFQYNAKLIGCGILYQRKKVIEEYDGNIYHGKLCFYPESIINIDSITFEEIKEIDDTFKVGRGPGEIKIDCLNKILNLIEKRWKRFNITKYF